MKKVKKHVILELGFLKKCHYFGLFEKYFRLIRHIRHLLTRYF